ncbi:MAG: hydroxyacid dehydrogenase [Inquilinaceae bacterium]
MTRIVVSEFMTDRAVRMLQNRAEVLYDPDLVDDPDRLNRAASGCAALIVRNRTQVRGGLLDALAGARAVGRLGVGLDNIDVEGCRARGIAVIPATGANAVAVAEYVIAALLILTRGAFGASDRVLAGTWPRAELVGGEISGRTLGLVGFGDIARQVGRRAAALGMEVVAHDPFVDPADPVWKTLGVRPVDLAALIAESDAVSLHVPLTPDTRHLVDAARLAGMKRGAILINTARGGIVDETAVADALRSGRLGGAALDVFAGEPLAAGGPLVGAPNLIATPHIAGVTAESNDRVSALIAEKVLQALEAA